MLTSSGQLAMFCTKDLHFFIATIKLQSTSTLIIRKLLVPNTQFIARTTNASTEGQVKRSQDLDFGKLVSVYVRPAAQRKPHTMQLISAANVEEPMKENVEYTDRTAENKRMKPTQIWMS
jgi:hypothetical protein